MKINGKTLEERIKDIPEGQNIPHHTDRWYNSDEKMWVVQLKDKYENQIGDAPYVHSEARAINIEKEFEKVIIKFTNCKYFMDIHRDSCEFGWVYRGVENSDKIIMFNEVGIDEFTLEKDELMTYVEITKAEYNKRLLVNS